MDLVEFLRIRAGKYGGKPFLFHKDISVTYRTFNEITARIAYSLGKDRNDTGSIYGENY